VIIAEKLTGFWEEEEERAVIPSVCLRFGVPKKKLWNKREEDESQ